VKIERCHLCSATPTVDETIYGCICAGCSERLHDLVQDAERIRVDIDDAINSGDGVPRRWWLAQKHHELELVEEELRGFVAVLS